MDAVPQGLVLEFDVENIYFAGALRSYQDALQLKRTILEREGGLRWLDLFTHYQRWDLGDEIDPDVDLSQVDAATDQLLEAFELLSQALVSTHVFAVMTLEAHVNAVAQEKLEPAIWNAFDRMPIKNKWLMLPKLLGRKGFEPGAEPYQSFAALVALRNGFVHLKSSARARLVPHDVTPEEWIAREVAQAQASLNVPRDMAKSLAGALGTEPPQWVHTERLGFYRVEWLDGDAT